MSDGVAIGMADATASRPDKAHLADLRAMRARATQQSVLVEDYGFAAAASGSTNRQAILDAVGAACGYQDAAAMDVDRPAASLRRDARKKIILPAGEYDIDTFPELKSTWMLTVEGAGKDVTQIHVTGGTAGAPVESGLKLNGVGYSVFRDFSIVIDGDAIYGIYGLWDIATSQSSFTQNKFYNIAVSGKFRTAGFKVGLPGSSLQEDQTAWYSCRAVGGAKDNATYWQAAFHFGSGVTGNNLIHALYDVAGIHCRHGVTSDRTGVMVYGGILQSNEADAYLTGPADYFLLSGIRSEGSTRLIETGGAGNTVPFNASIEDCTFHCGVLNADGRFVAWNFAGALALRNVMAIDAAPGVAPHIYCATPAKPVTVHAVGLALEGTPVDQAVIAGTPSLVTAELFGYDQLSGDVSAAHTPHRTLPTPAVTGSRGGNAALASMLTTLATGGYLTDGTAA